jgi:hypothetical protein
MTSLIEMHCVISKVNLDVYVSTQTRKLPIPVRGSAIPVLVPILELPSDHFLFYVSWIVLLLWSVLAAQIVCSTGIVTIESCLYWYWHLASTGIWYWHPYSNNASTDMEHVTITNTSTVIHMMPVLVTFIFANCANTSTGISLMTILVLVLS